MFTESGYAKVMVFVFNPVAFKHGVIEQDIQTAMTTALVD
jgi:hypothetical protein